MCEGHGHGDCPGECKQERCTHVYAIIGMNCDDYGTVDAWVHAVYLSELFAKEDLVGLRDAEGEGSLSDNPPYYTLSEAILLN